VVERAIPQKKAERQIRSKVYSDVNLAVYKDRLGQKGCRSMMEKHGEEALRGYAKAYDPVVKAVIRALVSTGAKFPDDWWE
jgi:hypothetical protein